MDSDHGSSAKWDAADRVLFSWLDLPVEQIDERLGAMAHRDPAMAAALHSRLAQLRRLGMVAPATVSEPTAGRTFGGYEIVRLLGVGGMGSVYLAEQRSPRRQVALKVIRPDRLGDRAARDRFQREARAVAALRDPGICAVIEVGEAEGTPFLAMQYIEGETLAERLAAQRALGSDVTSGSSGPRTPADIHGVLRLVEKVARSLHVAHEAGVVHRDIKPGNLMIDRNGEPVVLDFGLAHVHGAAGEVTLTRTGDVLGTPAYMSPEQVRPVGQAIDRRTDVYSLAATLFECLTLARPFASANEVELYERILRDPTPDPRRYNPHVPVDVGTVIGKAMEKEPARRYADAAEFADDLARLQRRELPLARRVGALGRAWRWAQRNPRAAVLMTSLVAAVVATSVFWWQAADQREQAREARVAADRRSEDVETMLDATTTSLDRLLVDLPGSRAARQLLVDRGMAVLQRIDADPHRSFRSRALLAGNVCNLADIAGLPSLPNLGDQKKALDLYDVGLSRYELLVEQAPREATSEDHATLLRNVSISYEHRATLLESMGRFDAALADFRAAMRFVDRFLQLDPEASSRFRDRGTLQTAIARLCYHLQRTEDAAAGFAEGRRTFEQGLTKTPDDGELLYGLAANLEAHGLLARFLGASEQAAGLFAESLKIHDRLLRATPTSALEMAGVISTSCNFAEEALGRGDKKAAEDVLRPAVGIARSLHDADPHDVNAAEALSRVILMLARVLANTHRRDEALVLVQQSMRAIEVLEPVRRPLSLRREWTYHAELATAVLSRQGKKEESLAIDTRVLAERRAFLQEEDSVQSRCDLLVAFRNLRSDFLDLAQDQEALRLDEERRTLAAGFASSFPHVPRLQVEHLDAVIDLGRGKAKARDGRGARALFVEALDMIDRAKDTDADAFLLRQDAVKAALAQLEGG